MKTFVTLAASIALAFTLSAADTEKGFKSIFNGKDLTGWEGNPDLWSVKDGCITGQTTAEKVITHNTFLIWKGGEPGDFELRCQWKLTTQNEKGFGNSGVQYRSKVLDPKEWVVGGYQADIATDPVHTGILYEERGRGILANCGEKVVITGSEAVEKKGKKMNKPKLEATRAFGTVEEIQAQVKKGEWNDYVIIAKGNHLQHFLNGHQTADVTDNDAAGAAKSGILALQLHVGGAMTIQFKDVRLKELPAAKSAKSDLKEMQGRWEPAEIIAEGQPVPAEAIAQIKMTVTGNNYTVQTADGGDGGTFQLEESLTPKRMDITTKSGDRITAIYEFNGDTMRVCYAINGATRPGEFSSGTGTSHVLAVYRRRK